MSSLSHGEPPKRAERSSMDQFSSIIPYSTRQTGTEMENLVQWILTPSDILDELEHNLRGEVQIKRGVWEQRGEQLLNDIGIRKILSRVGARINKVMIMSKFDKRVIYEMMFYLAQDLRVDFFTNFEKYEIEFNNLDTICGMVKDLVEGALLQAEEGGARRIWSRIHKVTQSIIEDRTKKKSYIPGQLTGE